MGFSGALWVLWGSMGRYGALWGSTDQVLVEQDVLLCYGMAMGPYGALWDSVGFYWVL